MLRTHLTLFSIIILAAPARNSGGQAIYDSISSETDGVAAIGDLVIDDLHVSGGGLLQTVTIALSAVGIKGSTQTTDVMLTLAVDGDDGFPAIGGPGDDAFLLQAGVTGVEVPVGEALELSFDVSDHFSIVPADALLFSGVELTNPSVGHVYFGSPSPGSTDGFVISFAAMSPQPVPSAGDPKLTSSDALGFRLDVVQLPAPATGGEVVGDVIDFESFDEGFQGTELTIDGVTFFDGRDGFFPPDNRQLTIDDGTGAWEKNPGMLDFVGGKLLNLNAFTGGPDGFAFAALKSLRIDPGGVRSGVTLSVAHVVATPDVDFSTSTITLLALLDEEMVATAAAHPDTVFGTSGGGTFTFGATTVELAGVDFDSLVLFCNGPGPFGSVQMGIDNVIFAGPDEPADLNGDGVVDGLDLGILLANWSIPVGSPGCGGAPGGCASDLNGDGAVDGLDLGILLASWTLPPR